MTPDLANEALASQIAFLQEIDRLKGVLRATPICDNSRPENSAEHSWHLAMYAMVLVDQAGPDVRIDRVIRMLLLHDIVEIDAGDVPIHLVHDSEAQAAKERVAAERIFGLLPAEQGAEFRALWEEFEAAQTPDAVFAKSIDRVQPLLLNLANGGGSWIDYHVTMEQIDARVGTKVNRGAPALWRHVRARVAGYFAS
ncbi:HD domain-containing protein [Tropicimonas isoalkanivorans]|uniref:Putative hydrolases of HD superfamily n=1 Tax=Tropicimonas isoalkanivorans TaxID=441112 RepID=A0A1I1IMI8_9RHOB|nr:HD domain-containing protein [Tropicimonas isoalkanivorans]SFC37456.1 putative hydrolases of HD superfamily [Tropicimonas isoalkanivorans]